MAVTVVKESPFFSALKDDCFSPGDLRDYFKDEGMLKIPCGGSMGFLTDQHELVGALAEASIHSAISKVRAILNRHLLPIGKRVCSVICDDIIVQVDTLNRGFVIFNASVIRSVRIQVGNESLRDTLLNLFSELLVSEERQLCLLPNQALMIDGLDKSRISQITSSGERAMDEFAATLIEHRPFLFEPTLRYDGHFIVQTLLDRKGAFILSVAATGGIQLGLLQERLPEDEDDA